MNEDILAGLAPHGHLRAAINMSNFLLVSGEDKDGQPDGLSPDMAREIARRIGVRCELIPFAGPDCWLMRLQAISGISAILR